MRHILIEPGKPMQNGYIESFNGKIRDESLNEQWFECCRRRGSPLRAGGAAGSEQKLCSGVLSTQDEKAGE